MIIERVLGNQELIDEYSNYALDEVYFEWYELNKKIHRKFSSSNADLGLRIHHHSPPLRDSDVLYIGSDYLIVVRVKHCKCISIAWHNHHELARIAYEAGNRHAPLFFSEDENEKFLMPFDQPTFDMFARMRFDVSIVDKRLIKPISSSSLSSHSHAHQIDRRK